MNNPKVSIITVCLNAAMTIERTIRSVMDQAYQNIEYIIIDGMSTDGTPTILDAYRPKIASILSEKDGGIYDAMNKGLAVATGDILYFLNADDALFDRDVIGDVVRAFEEHPGVGLLYGKVHYEGEPLLFSIIHKNRERVRDKKDCLTAKFCQQNIFAKKWVYEKTGSFSAKYTIASDFEWMITAIERSVGIACIDRYVVTFYYGGMHTKHPYQTIRERLDIIRRHYSAAVYAYYFMKSIVATVLYGHILNRAHTKP